MHKMFIASKSSQRHLCGDVVRHTKKSVHSASFGFYGSEISSIFAVIKFELNERARIHKL